MSKKGKNRDAPFRTLVDSSGRAEWLRDKGRGHPGFGELLKPGSGKRKKHHLAVVQQFTPKSHKHDALRRSPKGGSAAQDMDAMSVVDIQEKPKTSPNSRIASISVPLPSERVIAEQLCGFRVPRDGQTEFRNLVLAAYGMCCVTACPDETALQAAHIIPYVNRLSNILPNGLCLRADIHYLFDRNLLGIDPSFVVHVSNDVRFPEYRKLQGCRILLPASEDSYPSAELLRIRSTLLDPPQS